eukprot:TRINITY_DN220_c0_g4_i2.p1 TRINITY_DN220_c0_g4~~TRINITY_DN220_c0_g4_i2.p1  ORF type:complete len:702 (+),score=236.14 TRINITY_DN220_c0_g4_i2:29-2134(+)
MQTQTRLMYPITKREVNTFAAEPGLPAASIPDPYRWLENLTSVETREWINKQQQLSNNYLNNCKLKNPLFEKIKKAFDYPKFSSPFKRNNKVFYFMNTGLQNQDVLYFTTPEITEPKILIDPNALASDGTISLKTLEITNSGKYISYCLSKKGSDSTTIYVKNIETLENLPDKIDNVKFSGISWTKDESGFFYSKFEMQKQDENENLTVATEEDHDHKIFYHQIGTDSSQDQVIFSIPEQPKWIFSAEITFDQRFLLIYIYESTAPVNKLYIKDLNNERAEIQKIIDNFGAEYTYIANNDNDFYFKTNLNAPMSRIIKINIENPNIITEIVPEQSYPLCFVIAFNQNFMILNYLVDVKDVIKIYNLNGEYQFDINLPSLGSVSELNCQRNDSEFYLKFISFLHPGTIFKYNILNREMQVFKDITIPGIDLNQFTTEQIFFLSKDGTKIPMFIVRKKEIEFNSNNPIFLYGYGGFSIPITPFFSCSNCIFAQDYNVILAFPNIRGGAEYGENWHTQAILEKKHNSFDDFCCAAEYLIENKYTNPTKISICGGSNGGFLVASCLNRRPELFGCGIVMVGVLDLLRFHLFTIGKHWVSDYGNPDNPEHYNFIIKNSPLHNIPNVANYPAVLLTTADFDDRVVPLHSFKFIAELQFQYGNKETQTNPLLINIDSKSGHGAGKSTESTIIEKAEIFAFIAKSLNFE